MTPEKITTSISIIEESAHIKDELLLLQDEMQAAAHAVLEAKGPHIRSSLNYDAATSAPLDDLVDSRISSKSAVVSPEVLAMALPLSENSVRTTRESRKSLENIIRHEDNRMIAIVGPCSIHDAEAAIEYAEHVREWREQYKDQLEVVMRFYIEKPRTEKDWKGLIYDPLLNDTDDINLGVVATRLLACRITDMLQPLATERLNANTPQFLNGLIAYDAIGARNAEDQKAREYMSGTSSVPGQKNPQSGDLAVAVQAVVSANAPHAFLGVDENGTMAQVNTIGNDVAHIILRGGANGPNYEPKHIDEAKTAIKRASKRDLPVSIVVDASHGNSMKKAELQAKVIRSVSEQVALGEVALCGVMIESNLVHGSQKLRNAEGTLKRRDELQYGLSVTDACVGIDETNQMLQMLSAAVQQRHRL